MKSGIVKLLNALMSWFFATLLVCVGFGLFYVFHRADEELQFRVESKLAEIFPQHSVTIEKAKLIPGEGIRLHGLSIVENPMSDGSGRTELAYCNEVTLYCQLGIEDLVHGKFQLDSVLLRGLALRPTKFRDGKWNLAKLLSPSSHNALLPTIRVEDGKIDVVNQQLPHPSIISVLVANATISPPHLDEQKLNRIAIRSTISHDACETFEATTHLYPDLATWTSSGVATGLECSSDLWRLVDSLLAGASPLPAAADLRGLKAMVNFEFRAAKGKDEPQPQFEISGNLTDGRWEAPDFLDHPISDVTINSFNISQHREKIGWDLFDVSGRYGAANISLSASGTSFDPSSDVTVVGNARDFQLTPRMVRVLSPRLQAIWAKYQFVGLLNADHYEIRRRNGGWSMDADVECLDTSLQCVYFPYRVTNTIGTIRFRHRQKLNVDLRASTPQSAGRRPIHIWADIASPGPTFTGEIKVKTDEWMKLDAQLNASLAPAVQNILDDMQAQGDVAFNATLRRVDLKKPKLEKDINIFVRQASVQYERFPYPLQNVSGRIHVAENRWDFYDFAGQNDSCVVNAVAKWLPHVSPQLGKPSGELVAEFVARNIPCDAELHGALPRGPQQVWQSLRPTGHIDYAKIDLTYRSDVGKPEIDARVRQMPAIGAASPNRLDILPTWFPLRMDRVTGEVNYNHDGTFSMTGLRAEHGSQLRSVSLHANGGGKFWENGAWEVRLDKINVDGMETSPELTAALPAELASAMRQVQFRGQLWIHDSSMRFVGNGQPGSFVSAEWTSRMDINNGSLMVGGHKVDSVYGHLTVSGARTPEGTRSRGQAVFDTLLCKGIQITEVNAPWMMDDSRLLFGAGANSTVEDVSPSLRAKVFDGSVLADGEVSLVGNNAFRFQGVLHNFDVAKLTRDLDTDSSMTGRGEARLHIAGNAEGKHTWKGAGVVLLRDANLAKLPPIIALVNEVRDRDTPPDVFTSSDIDFTIEGRNIDLNRFDLHGESLTLKGRGWANMDRKLDLTFYTILGGEKRYLPSVRWLIGQTSSQWLQILVTGTIDDMHMERKFVPALNDLLLDQARQPGRIGSR